MPELTPKERLQPSLLDRLTDDEPSLKQESRDMRVLSPARLRTSVLRDLSWLFNTTNLAAMHDLEAYPQVAGSVLNYGLPDLAGHTISGIDGAQLEQILKQAILNFEPRLIANSIRVRLVTDRSDSNHNNMSLVVEAQLWSQPLPLRLHLRTEIDLEDGDIRVAELRDSEPRAKG
jgi:type VI secretion system protein ImpF